jgi:GMP synthase (glutamine-hydrolysing)
MTAPILIILHQEHSTPGRLGHALIGRGFTLDIRRPRFGEPLPATMAEHSGAVIFGGPQSANDEDEFIRRETDWLAVPLKEGKPFLGICLGAQMLARHLGASVFCHADGPVEVGYYPVRPTKAGLDLCETWPSSMYQWHREGFDLPSGAELLAEGDTFAVQMFRAGSSAYGIQFHPEVTHAMMCRWTVRASERLALPGAQDRARQIEGRYMHDPNVARWLNAFLDDWLAPSAEPAQAAEAHAAKALGRT